MRVVQHVFRRGAVSAAHGGDNITEERYVSSAKLKQMREALEKLPIVTGAHRVDENLPAPGRPAEASAAVGSSEKANAGSAGIVVRGQGFKGPELRISSLREI